MADEDVPRFSVLRLAFGLDEGESHVPIQDGIVGQVDFFLGTFAQELLDLVAAVGEGRWSVRWGGAEGPEGEMTWWLCPQGLF